MSTISIKSMTAHDLKNKIENGLNPNELLEEAALQNRLELVRLMLDYGASVTTLFDKDSQESFLKRCPPDVAKYFDLFNLSRNENGALEALGAAFLETVLDELSTATFGNGYFAKRNTRFDFKDKTPVWSIGLIVREVTDINFMTDLLRICDLYDWESRYSGINRQARGSFVLATITNTNFNKSPLSKLADGTLMDTLYVSPNIAHYINFYLVQDMNLTNVLSDITWNGFETIVGIMHYEKESKIFKANGQIDIGIFNEMKTVVSQMEFKRNNLQGS